MVTLTVTLGVPGSGKSTWAEAQPAWWACTDLERTGDVSHDRFIEALQARALRQLRAGVDVVTDGCNVDHRTRRSWLDLGRRAGARCVLAIVECDADEALRRNAGRPHGERVPHQRMLRYLERTSDVKHDRFIEALQARALRQLRAGVDVVTDGCNVDHRTRRSWLELGRRVDARCVLAIVECDADEALRRNAGRPHGERVPHQRMLRYLERLPVARTQVGAEGWDDITYTSPRSVVAGATRTW